MPDLDFGKMLVHTKKSFGIDFWIEAFMILLCPPPYWDVIIDIKALNPANTTKVPVYYLLSDFILAFMFVRLLFLTRAVINYSIFMDIYSKRLCKSYGFTANVRFAMKCFVRSHPGTSVLLLLILTVFILAYLLRIAELPYGVTVGNITWEPFTDSVWCIIITMTTVGYGDIAPKTIFGRIVAVLAALWGTFLVSILIISVGNIF